MERNGTLAPVVPQRRERHGEGVFRHIRGDVLEAAVDTAVDVHQHLRGVLDAQGEGDIFAQRRVRIADFQQLNPRLVRHADGNRLGVGHSAGRVAIVGLERHRAHAAV